jgi:membrane-associated phospholipid phosphatase
MIRKVKIGVKKLSEAIAVVSVELLILFIAFFISLVLLIVVIRKIFFVRQDAVDYRVFDYLMQFISPAHTALMKFFTIFGSPLFLIPAYLILISYYFFIRKKKWYSIKMLTIASCNLLLLFGLKLFFDRPRPLIPLLKKVPGLSFPSGHAFMSLTFFGIIIYIIYRDVANKWLKWISIVGLLIMIFMVGLSRVYLRVHYASDVIGGYCFGVITLVILFIMLGQIEKFNARKLPERLNITETEEGISGK